MKKLILTALSVFLLGSVHAQTVTFTPSTPVAGQPLSFVYDPAGGSLDKLANVTCVAQTFINSKQKPVAIDLKKEGDVYKGSFTPVDSTAIAVLVFTADGAKDDNPKGYYTLFYKDGKPTAMAKFWEYQFYNGMGTAFSGAKADKPKALASLNTMFSMDPSVRSKYLTNYMSLLYQIDRESATSEILKEIAALNKQTPMVESTLAQMAVAYNIIKRRSSADSVNAIIVAKYPKGTLVYSRATTGLYNEKDAVKKEEKLAAIIKDFGLNPAVKADAAKLENLYATVASAYGLAKNNAKFTEYTNKIQSKTTVASLYNSYAWAGAEKKENLEFAAGISKKSLALLDAAKNDPAPDYFSSKEEYLKGLESSYASFADTYALLLDHLGDHKEALKIQEQAVTKNNYGSADMNARYVSFLAKAGQKEKTVQFAERFIKEGQGTAQMKEELKAAYSGSQPFESYYASLEKVATDREKAKFMKEMINMPAPLFSLASLSGKTVSLADLKGKVVIVDYWATWCGPCIASFPGMQLAVNKYKDDPNVVFLFVNTFQREDDREKVVRDYLATTTYTFNVLLDTKNKQDPNRFDVVDKYGVDGIPTKFIIDGNGNIRFKKVGFGGSAEGTVKELDMMISMAKAGTEQSK